MRVLDGPQNTADPGPTTRPRAESGRRAQLNSLPRWVYDFVVSPGAAVKGDGGSRPTSPPARLSAAPKAPSATVRNTAAPMSPLLMYARMDAAPLCAKPSI